MKQTRRTDFKFLALEVHNQFFLRSQTYLRGLVVDLGCGEKPYREDVVGRNCRYLGIDWPSSLHAVEPDVVTDLNQGVPLADGCADVVMSFSVLEHLHRPAMLLEESIRILKPGGHLLLQVPFQWHVHEAPIDYVRFTRHGLERLLNDAGFDSAEINADCGFWVTWILKFNYQSTRWIRGSRVSRSLARLVLVPVWWLGQWLAPILDRIDFNAAETASYTIVASKPS